MPFGKILGQALFWISLDRTSAIIKMSDSLCGPCLGISASIYDAVSRESDTTMLAPLWHKIFSEIYTSSLTRKLCALVMKSWSQCRAACVETATLEVDYDLENPPTDLHSPIHEIPAYHNNTKIKVYLAKGDRAANDGRNQLYNWHFVCDCKVQSTTSFDVHPHLRTEIRLGKYSDEDGALALERDTVCAPEEIMVRQLEQGDDVGDLVPANPLSKQSMTTAKLWLKNCVKGHGRTCQPHEKPRAWVPSRFLEITPGSSKIYLREKSLVLSGSVDDDDRYVALSHCWGAEGTPLTTTRKTLSCWVEQDIEISELPRTFRDAVILVASLGIRYLWIDSLCILQDHPDDWAREAAQMADIYRYAHLVIIAANSPGDTLGFLTTREPTDVVPLPLPPTSSSPTESTSTKLCLQLHPFWASSGKRTEKPDHLQNEPLSSRAWCLQERYLPTRALQYGTRQAFWECQYLRANEDGEVAVHSRTTQRCHVKRLARTANVQQSVFAKKVWQPAEGELGENSQYNWEDWYSMIEDYTARDITKPTDRFPAVAGLAREIGRVKSGNGAEQMESMTGEYMAGLWKSGVLEGLFLV